MKKEFEKKLYNSILADTRKIFKDDNTVTQNYYDCWCYYNEIIDMVSDSGSEWLLNNLYEDRDEYKNKYLHEKGLM